MKKILIIIGTRPEAIKIAPIIKELKNNKNFFSFKVCATGQHKKMLKQALNFFNIVPDFNINVMKKNQRLEELTSKILIGVSKVLEKYHPDMVIVHGDTTTTLAASLAAYYKKIDICHIESGLRTQNIYSPWPEEINRKLTSHLAKFHFSPTINSKKNLILENINSKYIKVTGNTVLDSLLFTKKIILSSDLIKKKLDKKFFYLDYSKKIILVTGHRRENFGAQFKNILKALKYIADKNKDILIIYPVHLNPKILIPVKKILNKIPNIFLVKPEDYLSFVYLMSRAYIIVTDSGGIQEEAPSLGKPVLVIRNTTERPEGVKAGNAKLVGTNTKSIIKNIEDLLFYKKNYLKMCKTHNPYGNGDAGKKIIEHLKSLFIKSY
jgi:UDP-N-acetylglucosamine 2-epimerase (non-hydrolysing)